MTRIVLTRESCFGDIMHLYQNVAFKSDIDMPEGSTITFDVTKIRVTKPVMDEVCRYLQEKENAALSTIDVYWFEYGPKTSLDGNDFIAEYDDGFITVDIPFLLF